MKITVNANSHEISAVTLSAALSELGINSPTIATAVNGSFVPRSERIDMALKDGDRLEVLSPMQGG